MLGWCYWLTAIGRFWPLCLLSGIGNSVFHPADYSVMNHAFARKHVGQAFGWHIFGGNIGYIISPIVMTALILSLGWRTGVVVAGLLCVPVVFVQIWQNRVLTIKPTIQTQPDEKAEADGLKLLMSRTMILLLLFYTVATTASAGLQTWLITLLHTQHGLTLSLAASDLTTLTAGIAVGVLFGGWLTGQTSRLLLVQVLTLIPAAALVTMIALPLPLLALFALIFVLGICAGTMRAPRDLITKDSAPSGQVSKVFG